MSFCRCFVGEVRTGGVLEVQNEVVRFVCGCRFIGGRCVSFF